MANEHETSIQRSERGWLPQIIAISGSGKYCGAMDTGKTAVIYHIPSEIGLSISHRSLPKTSHDLLVKGTGKCLRGPEFPEGLDITYLETISKAGKYL